MLMAADVGLVGAGLRGPGLPSAATQVSMAPLGGLIGSALSGSSAAAGSMLGAVAASQVVLPAVSFSGVQAGTLAIQSNATAGGPRVNAPPAPASTVAPEAALENGTPGQSAAGPVSPPASAGGPSSAGSSHVGPAPDPQKGGRYEPQWGMAPSMPGGPLPPLVWVPSGPSSDEEGAMALGGDNQEARREIEELIKRLQSEGPFLGGVPSSFSRWIKGLYDLHERRSLTNDGYGPCVSWVLGIENVIRDSQANGVYAKAEGIIWDIESLSPIAWGNHVGVRITVTVGWETRSFYMDNGWIGGATTSSFRKVFLVITAMNCHSLRGNEATTWNF